MAMRNDRPREPILNLPAVVAACIAGLIGLHGIREFLPQDVDIGILLDYAFIPAQWLLHLHPEQLPEIAQAAEALPGRQGEALLAVIREIEEQGGPGWWTWASYGALHGSWAHVLVNSVWLAAFGTPVARRLGALRFLALALATTLGGSIAHYWTQAESVAPMVGASAAVSGMMAAALRFMYAPPRYDALTGRPLEAHELPRQSFGRLVRDRRAALFLGVWFAINLATGLLAAPLGIVSGSIAWEAHVGGFLAGLALFPYLDRIPRGE
jgi:membrane associated rhomboid family serine protease